MQNNLINIQKTMRFKSDEARLCSFRFLDEMQEMTQEKNR